MRCPPKETIKRVAPQKNIILTLHYNYDPLYDYFYYVVLMLVIDNTIPML